MHPRPNGRSRNGPGEIKGEEFLSDVTSMESAQIVQQVVGWTGQKSPKALWI